MQILFEYSGQECQVKELRPGDVFITGGIICRPESIYLMTSDGSQAVRVADGVVAEFSEDCFVTRVNAVLHVQ